MSTLQPRYYDYDENDCSYIDSYGRCYKNSAWNNWIRWVVLAVVVVGFFLLFVCCSCITARRRRKAGATPFYGTGWAARPGAYTTQPHYNNNNNHQPAPPYSAQPQPQGNNGYYGAPPPQYGGGENQGYYGQQQGVELQSPQPTYTHPGYNRDGGDVYAPPAGPPPGKMV